MTSTMTRIIGALLGALIFFAVGAGLAHAGGGIDHATQSRGDNTPGLSR